MDTAAAAAAAVPGNYSAGWPSERLRQLNDEIAAQLAPAMLFVALLMLVGLAGNAVVCFVFFFRLRMSAQHVLIMSLAAFDLLSCLIAMPTEIVDMRYFLVFRNEFACRLLRFINFFSAFASILTLVVIAVDRYLKVCRPLGPRLSLRHTKMALAAVIAVALVAAVPAPILYGVRTTSLKDDDSGLVLQAHDCSTSDATKTTIYPTAYSCVLFAAFIVTLGALGIIYAKILREMRVHNVYMKRNSVYRCNSTRSRGRAGSVSVISTTTTFTTDPPSSGGVTEEDDEDDLPTGGWFTAFRNSFRLSRSSRKGGQESKVPEIEAPPSEGDIPTEPTLTTLAGREEAEAVQMNVVERNEFGGEQEGSSPATIHGESNLGSPDSCASAWIQPGPELQLPPASASTPNAGNCPPRIFITPDDDSRVTGTATFEDLSKDPALSPPGGQTSPAPGDRDSVDMSEVSCLQLSNSSLMGCSSTDPVGDQDQDLPSVINDRDLFPEAPEAAGSTFLEYDYDSSAANDSCLQDWYGVRLNAVGIVLTSVWTQNANYSDTETSEDNPMFLRPWDTQGEIDLNSSMNSIASSTPFVDGMHENEEHVESCVGSHRQRDTSFSPTSVYNLKAAITLSADNEGHEPDARNSKTNFIDSCPDSDFEYTCLESDVLVDCYVSKSQYQFPGASSDAEGLTAVESGVLSETAKDIKKSSDCVATNVHGGQVESYESKGVNSDSDSRLVLHLPETKEDPETKAVDLAHICDNSGLDRAELKSDQLSPSHSRTFLVRNPARIQNSRSSPVTRRAMSASSQPEEEEEEGEEETPDQNHDQNHQQPHEQQTSSNQQARPRTAKRKLSKKNSSASSGTSSKTPEAVRTSKATAVAIAVTCVFFFSFLPFLALAVGRAVHGDFDRRLRGAGLVFYNVFLRFYFINAVANPLIYGLLNSSFRKQCLRLARKVLGFCPWRRRRCSRFAVSQS